MAAPIVPTLATFVIIVFVKEVLSGLEEEIAEFSSSLGHILVKVLFTTSGIDMLLCHHWLT